MVVVVVLVCVCAEDGKMQGMESTLSNGQVKRAFAVAAAAQAAGPLGWSSGGAAQRRTGPERRAEGGGRADTRAYGGKVGLGLRCQLGPTAAVVNGTLCTRCMLCRLTCAVSAVTAVVAYAPWAMHALRSAWMPAPPPLSLPAMASTRGTCTAQQQRGSQAATTT